MKWFKHMTSANSDNKIVTLRVQFGMWGVGCYWTILEMVAEQMKANNPKPEATFSLNELSSFLGCLQNECGMKVEHSGDIIKIKVPKLLKIKDNYLKDLEATSKQLPSIEQKEKENKKEKESTYKADFESIWKEYPRPEGKKQAYRHYLSTVKDDNSLINIGIALKNYRECETVKKGFIKKGSTWFNEWEDWINPKPDMMGKNQKTDREIEHERLIEMQKDKK
jgi:hypothetical protein